MVKIFYVDASFLATTLSSLSHILQLKYLLVSARNTQNTIQAQTMATPPHLNLSLLHNNHKYF